MLGNDENCLLQTSSEYWCGQSFNSRQYYVYTIIQLHVMVIILFISLLVVFLRYKNKNRFATAISIHVSDVLLVGHLLFIVIKDYIFDSSVIHNKSGEKYIFCNVAASFQMAGLCSHAVLVPVTWFLLKDSLQIMSKLNNRLILSLPLIGGIIICLCAGDVFFGLKFCTLNDACSYAIAAREQSDFHICLILPAILVVILTISIVMTVGFFCQSLFIITKSVNALMKVGGSRTGNSFQASDVVKIFVQTSLLSIILQLVIVIYNCLVMIDIVDINREIQFIVTVYVIPGVTIFNTGSALVRFAKAKYKQLD